MAAKVFANKMAIAAKTGAGKLIAAFPDPCNSPPAPPTGPMPIPYPNSSFSRDLKQGTKRVLVGGKPAAVEDSYFKTSPLGNEAATKSFGASLLTHTITGKAYFNAFSMDVTFEGRKVVRHLDLMTSNHASYPGGTPPFGEMEEMALLALADPHTDLCPCCWSSTCTAALSNEITAGVPRESMSFQEFYNLDEVDETGALTAKATQRRADLAANKCLGGSCPNARKPLPKSDPPCDVYRVLTVDESTTNTRGISADRLRELRKQKGVPLSKDQAAQKILGGAFKKAGDLRSSGWSENQIAKYIQIDHTTPRSAGGCPSSENNTTAHNMKCANCKVVDEHLDNWSNQELTSRRTALGV